MPFIQLQTNKVIRKKNTRKLLKELTDAVHTIKKDKVEMISASIKTRVRMSFGGNSEDAVAVFKVDSFGFTEEITAKLTRSFTASLSKYITINPERIYIFFSETQFDKRYMVGWNNKTFKEIIPDPVKTK